jgi:hypothetical protein
LKQQAPDGYLSGAFVCSSLSLVSKANGGEGGVKAGRLATLSCAARAQRVWFQRHYRIKHFGVVKADDAIALIRQIGRASFIALDFDAGPVRCSIEFDDKLLLSANEVAK